ncbi:hypothetical protein FisN_9Lu032 [Fistulifera solaris]|uniref:Uncharacterized protein n=1 Tax=Fistulifera solaris TaxID=1519565 RepID=A0A1Z5JHC3_FISSO|nr:hypothetical protein FisN_9Lu032 [Fistulifera solaris]|eukprot:GAX13389.1 hypothetical protein FisN_9Lu032 [Fistulifera solaris]
MQLLSKKDFSAPHFPIQESTLGQQCLNLRTQSLFSDSLIDQLRNETVHEFEAFAWMRQHLRMNLTLPPPLPTPRALMPTLRLESAGVPMQNPPFSLGKVNSSNQTESSRLRKRRMHSIVFCLSLKVSR